MVTVRARSHLAAGAALPRNTGSVLGSLLYRTRSYKLRFCWCAPHGDKSPCDEAADEVNHWHSRLLERMRLDVMPLRLAVIDDTACDALDEVRQFRHLFRYAYSAKIAPLRLQLMMRKALALKEVYAGQSARFVEFLQGLA